MPQLTELNHPLVAHWLAELRDRDTGPERFRILVRHLSLALFLEASRDLELAPRAVQTPLAAMEGRQLAAAPLLIPILRAGLGMVDGILAFVPGARVYHLGIYRDHQTLEAVPYYTPHAEPEGAQDAFLLDPMLATGGSAVAALHVVHGWGVPRVRLLSIIGAPEGVQRVGEAFPEVPITLAGLDERLNEVGYIVPGLGDAGDRQFGS
jgi:uracil phosphoribosyltransferase